MICPKCGTEYREGFTECAYCHVPLVETLEDGTDPEALLKMSERKEEDTIKEDITPEEFLELARSRGLTESDIMNVLEDEAPAVESTEEVPLKPYRKAAERAEDIRSSAYTLIIIGVLGIVAVFLLYIGALPIYFSGGGKYITSGTMGAMFLLFLVIGINSYRKIRPLNEEAEREEKKIEEIRKYFFDSFSPESLDKEAMEENTGNVDSYFLRSTLMKKKLNERFMDLDPAFLEYIVDDLYVQMYSDYEVKTEAAGNAAGALS